MKTITRRDLDLAWSAGYLSSRGALCIKSAVIEYEIKSRDAWEEVVRFARPFDDLECLVYRAQSKGHDVAIFRVRGDKLRRVMERLWPHLTNKRRQEYTDLVERHAAQRPLYGGAPSLR